MPRMVVWPTGELEREAPADTERRQRDDERVRQASEDVGDAVDRADRGAGENHREHHSGAESTSPEHQPAHQRRQRRLAPTDRSMPRVRITRCWPIRDDGDHRRSARRCC
jgi:hypothetical protein